MAGKKKNIEEKVNEIWEQDVKPKTRTKKKTFDPASAQDAATKNYVDNYVSTKPKVTKRKKSENVLVNEVAKLSKKNTSIITNHKDVDTGYNNNYTLIVNKKIFKLMSIRKKIVHIFTLLKRKDYKLIKQLVF